MIEMTLVPFGIRIDWNQWIAGLHTVMLLSDLGWWQERRATIEDHNRDTHRCILGRCFSNPLSNIHHLFSVWPDSRPMIEAVTIPKLVWHFYTSCESCSQWSWDKDYFTQQDIPATLTKHSCLLIPFNAICHCRHHMTGFESWTEQQTKLGQSRSSLNTAAFVDPLNLSASFWFFSLLIMTWLGTPLPQFLTTPWYRVLEW